LNLYSPSLPIQNSISSASAEWASVFVASALLVATIAYTYFTKRQIETDNKPYIKSRLEYPSPKYINLIITNSGNGPAHDVEATWSIGDSSKEWEINLLSPSEKYWFKLPLDGPKEGYEEVSKVRERIQNSQATIEFEATCTNVLEQNYTFTDELDINTGLNRATNSSEKFESEPLEEIKKILEDMVYGPD
jgi:hypothetical protein